MHAITLFHRSQTSTDGRETLENKETLYVSIALMVNNGYHRQSDDCVSHHAASGGGILNYNFLVP